MIPYCLLGSSRYAEDYKVDQILNCKEVARRAPTPITIRTIIILNCNSNKAVGQVGRYTTFGRVYGARAQLRPKCHDELLHKDSPCFPKYNGQFLPFLARTMVLLFMALLLHARKKVTSTYTYTYVLTKILNSNVMQRPLF